MDVVEIERDNVVRIGEHRLPKYWSGPELSSPSTIDLPIESGSLLIAAGLNESGEASAVYYLPRDTEFTVLRNQPGRYPSGKHPLEKKSKHFDVRTVEEIRNYLETTWGESGIQYFNPWDKETSRWEGREAEAAARVILPKLGEFYEAALDADEFTICMDWWIRIDGDRQTRLNENPEDFDAKIENQVHSRILMEDTPLSYDESRAWVLVEGKDRGIHWASESLGFTMGGIESLLDNCRDLMEKDEETAELLERYSEREHSSEGFAQN